MDRSDGLPERDRRLAMLSLMLAAAQVTLDISIVYTALPAISADLQRSAAATVWVVSAYQLAVVAAVLPLAGLGEAIGHRRVSLAGLALFVVGSFACGLATTLPGLIAARLLQGLGAAAVISVTTALVRFVYPARSLGYGLGLYALVVAIALACGPTVASLVLSLTSWNALFLLHLPIGALSLALGLRVLPSTEGSGHRYDAVAAALTAGMFALLVYGLGEAAHRAPLARLVAIWGGAIVCAVLLLRRQAGHPAPMFAVDLLRRPLFALSAATAILSFVAQGLAFVSLPFLFHAVMGWSQAHTGLLMTTWPVVLSVMALNAGRLSDRWPAAKLGGAGLLLLCGGMVLLAMLGRDATAARHRLAPRAVRRGFRPVPGAEHERDHEQRAAGAKRWCERHRSDRADAGAGAGRGAGGGLLRVFDDGAGADDWHCGSAADLPCWRASTSLLRLRFQASAEQAAPMPPSAR